jgi:predicted dehydrogenase
VELTAVADITQEAHDTFMEQWGDKFPDTKHYSDYADMFAAEELDIVAVCTRGPHHYTAMMDVIKAAPKAIFLEKPATCSLEEMDAVVDAAKAADIPITVSYSRHWGPHVLRMAELIKDGLIGEVTGVVGHCGNSLLSFTSHQTDMICQFAGYDPVAVYARGTVPETDVPDGYAPEPALQSMVIEFASGLVGTQVATEGELGTIAVDIQGTEGRACVAFYKPPVAWNKKGEPIDLNKLGLPENASPFKLAYEQIVAHLESGPLPHCTNENFIAVHETGFAAIESILTGQRVEIPNVNRGRKVFANG